MTLWLWGEEMITDGWIHFLKPSWWGSWCQEHFSWWVDQSTFVNIGLKWRFIVYLLEQRATIPKRRHRSFQPRISTPNRLPRESRLHNHSLCRAPYSRVYPLQTSAQKAIWNLQHGLLAIPDHLCIYPPLQYKCLYLHKGKEARSVRCHSCIRSGIGFVPR